MSNDTQVKQEDDKEQIVRELLKGCSNWHDITHVIAPRIRKLLSEHEEALATVRREVFRDVLMVAKANLKIGPTDALDTGWNLALAELIAALEASATEKGEMNG